MPGDHLEPPSVGPLAPAELPEALMLLFADLDTDERSSRVAAALVEIHAAGGDDHILLAARRGQKLVAAVWLQIRPGNVGALQPPGLARSEADETAVDLINSAVSQAMAAGVRFVQSLLKTDAGPEARWLGRCGFRHVADLLYLVSPRGAFPRVKAATSLDFQPLDESRAAMDRLAAVIQQTYQGSQDCPAVHGLQLIGDALASYRATGPFDPSRWFIVRQESADIGCLLLTERPVSGPFPNHHDWELIYMGLCPEARGCGYGIEIVRHAQWLAANARAERLVLAVDAANSPAIRVYSAAGFETWDRRSVFLRTK